MLNKKKLVVTLILLSTWGVGMPVAAHADSGQEEELLSLLFNEDDLVETATRSLKPLSQVAENVTIVTAAEIEAMHAHSLGEVLKRQPGLMVAFDGQDFLGTSELSLLGSRRHHVLLLLDGVRLNLNSNGIAVTSFIPLGIIKRIEIIKGAASSTWGSALGGVINIITKDTGTTAAPTGTVRASYGEGQSRDLSADMAGRVAKVGYFLHGGTLDSNGLELDRYSERDSLYGKMRVTLPHQSSLTVTGGYSDPVYRDLNYGDAWGIPDLNLYQEIDHRNSWGTLYFDTVLTPALTLHLSVQHSENKYSYELNSLGTGIGGPEGDVIYGQGWSDEATSFTSHLAWAGESVSANLGFESSRSEMVYENFMGVFFGGPAGSEAEPVREERRGVYTNLTYVNGGFTITPGLRYDYHSQSEESINPSLGITYMVSPTTLLRGSVARGISAPYLSAAVHSPDLKPEKTWTYQAGVETAAVPALKLKTTVFHQQIEDGWETNSGTPWINAGRVRLNGVELEAETLEYYGVQFSGNFTYVSEDSMGDGSTDLDNDESYTANLILAYRNIDAGVRGELAGHYYWMNENVGNEAPDYDDMVCDLLLAKDVTLPGFRGEVYLKGRNIFNGNQYWDYEYPNPGRWLEAGLVLNF